MRFPATLIVLLCLALLPSSASALTPRIVGGTTATAVYPAQAQVDIDLAEGSYQCGGTLIAPQWILTAAHCVSDEFTNELNPANALTVRLGSNTYSQGTTHRVDAVSRAFGWDINTFAYDAALLHLATAASQAPLAILDGDEASAAAPGVTARVIGWGMTQEDTDMSEILLQADVPIVSDATCGAAYGTMLFAATMVCAGYEQGGIDACQGDSGGPLLVDVDGSSGIHWKLAGIVSTGEGCARAGFYGIYTDALNANLRTWIATTTGLDLGAAPVDTPAPSAPATPSTPSTPAAPERPAAKKAGLRLAKRCRPRACGFTVRFATGGTVSATVTVSRGWARRLGFLYRVVASAKRTFDAGGTQRLELILPGSLSRELRRHGRRTVPARMTVTAVTAEGKRMRASRAVTLRR